MTRAQSEGSSERGGVSTAIPRVECLALWMLCCGCFAVNALMVSWWLHVLVALGCRRVSALCRVMGDRTKSAALSVPFHTELRKLSVCIH